MRRFWNGCTAKRKAPALCRGLSDLVLRESDFAALLCVVGSDLGLLRIGRGKLAAEALDTASRVDQLLLAGKERVAGRADFHHDRALVGRTCVELVAARTLHVGLFILRMNRSLRHVVS